MPLEHLLSERLMKRYFGPQSDVGDPSIYLSRMPYLDIRSFGPNNGKVSMHIPFFGSNLLNRYEYSDHYYTNKEISIRRTGEIVYPSKPDRVTFANFDAFYNKIFVLGEKKTYNNVIFTGGESLLWQIQIAKTIRMCSEQFEIKNLTYEVETNGTIPVESELSDWIRRSQIIIRPDVTNAMGLPLLSQITNHRSASEKSSKWTHFDHKNWYIVFDFDSPHDKIEQIIKRYDISKNKVCFESQKSNKKCIKHCIDSGFNYFGSF